MNYLCVTYKKWISNKDQAKKKKNRRFVRTLDKKCWDKVLTPIFHRGRQ